MIPTIWELLFEFIDEYWWYLIYAFFAIIAITTFFMRRAALGFIYDRWTERTFSIMDLEFPTSVRYYTYIMTSLKMKYNVSEKLPLISLRKNLYWDFLFMAGIYPFIALLVLHAAKFDFINSSLFKLIAISQLLAWLLDVIENCLILKTTKNPKYFLKNPVDNLKIEDSEQESRPIFKIYKFIVVLKWVIALVGIFFSLVPIFYVFLFNKYYTNDSKWHGIFFTFLLLCTLLLFQYLTNNSKNK